MIQPNLLIIGFFGSIFILGVVIIYAFYSYYQRLTQFKNVEAEAYRTSELVVEQAHKRAEAIIAAAEDKARKLVVDTQTFREALEGDLRGALSKSEEQYAKLLEKDSAELIESYKAVFEKTKDQFVEDTKKSLLNLEDDMKKGGEGFRSMVQKEIISSEKVLQSQVEEEFVKFKEELTQEKNERLKKLGFEADKIVAELASDLLSRTLVQSDQEKLLFKSLERAKADGLF